MPRIRPISFYHKHAGPHGHAAQPVGRARTRCRGPPVYPVTLGQRVSTLDRTVYQCSMLGPARGQPPRPLPRNTASVSRLPPSLAMRPSASAACPPSAS
eukprot:3201165-Prymnesium_polylepis.1